MIRKLLPLFLALVGLAAGLGGGLMMRPSTGTPNAHEVSADHAPEHEPEASGHEPEYVKLNNQFIIPVVQDGRVASVVILALSLEVPAGTSEAVHAKEPKLRDSFLQVLFDHANAGGFRGSFTDGANLVVLRRALLESAQKVMPEVISDVLIADIARQDA